MNIRSQIRKARKEGRKERKGGKEPIASGTPVREL